MKIIDQKENKLLARRELVCTFPEGAGRLGRSEVIKQIAELAKVKTENVVIEKMRGRTGSRDLNAVVYIYGDRNMAVRQLPPYLLARGSPKSAAPKKEAKNR